MKSCSSIEREDEGHLNELADCFPAYFRGVEAHLVECVTDCRFEKNVVGADKSYCLGLDATSFADDKKRDDLAFDAGCSESIRISRRTRTVSERHLSFNLFGGERYC